MAELDSDLNDAAVFQLIPNIIVNGRVTDLELKKSKDSQAPYAQLEWTIDGGDYDDRKIKFDIIMLGGLTKDGKPQSLSNLCSFLHFSGVKWRCKHCDTVFNERHSFLIATKDDKSDGLKPGNYYCPNCKNPKPRIAYDPDDFRGATCGIRVGSRKEEGGDREFNKVTAYTDLIS